MVEDGGGDEMQLHEPTSPACRRAQPGRQWGRFNETQHSVHRADHDLRTSPCDPNSRLFSVRAGQQSSPCVLSILTRKGDRGRGAGEPWGCGSSRQCGGFFPPRAPSGWSWRNVGAAPPHPAPRPRDAGVHVADEFSKRAVSAHPRRLGSCPPGASRRVRTWGLGPGAGRDYSSSDRMTWKRVTL